MISIVITAFERAHLLERTLESIYHQKLNEPREIIVVEDGDDGGLTRKVCEEFGCVYVQRKNRQPVVYSNPAVPSNIGIRTSRGDVLIMQNAECEHIDRNVIAGLAEIVRSGEKTVAFASVMALDPNGRDSAWYIHPTENARPFMFCGAISRKFIFELGGYDEDFAVGYAFDDTWLGVCMHFAGAKFVFTDLRVNHLWHPSVNCWGIEANQKLFEAKLQKLMAGEITTEANVGREWGVADSIVGVGTS